MDSVLTHQNVILILQGITTVAGIIWLVSQWVAARSATSRATSAGLWNALRWSALVTFVALWAIATIRSAQGVAFRVPSMTLFMSALVIASLQWFNVWFVAWPSLSMLGTPRSSVRRQSVLRLNATTAVPLVFFLCAAQWDPDLGGNGRWIPSKYWLATAGLYFGLEAAALLLPRTLRAVLCAVPIWLILGAAMPLVLWLI